MRNKAVADLARAAAAYMEEHGFNQNGHYRDPSTGAVCAVGAIDGASGCLVGEGGSWFEPQLLGGDARILREEFRKRLPGGDGSIPRWNDNPATTKEEVIAVFNRIADELGG